MQGLKKKIKCYNKNTFLKRQCIAAKKLEQAKQKLIKKNYNEIYEHEAAHKSAAGSLGGSIHIVNNSAGIPVSGFVPIAMPNMPVLLKLQWLLKIHQVQTIELKLQQKKLLIKLNQKRKISLNNLIIWHNNHYKQKNKQNKKLLGAASIS